MAEGALTLNGISLVTGDGASAEESGMLKLTATQLDDILQQVPDIRIIYLTVTNNPTAFAYTADELTKLFEVLRKYWESGREIYIIADLAYIGTGQPADD